MRTISDVLDRAKKVQKVNSDYKLGLCLGIGESSLANYRHGRSYPDEKTCQKLAIAMGEDPIILMVEMHAQRTKDDVSKAMWLSVAKRLQMGFANVLLLVAVAIISIAGIALPAYAGGQSGAKSSTGNVYYVKSQRRTHAFGFHSFVTLCSKLLNLSFFGKFARLLDILYVSSHKSTVF